MGLALSDQIDKDMDKQLKLPYDLEESPFQDRRSKQSIHKFSYQINSPYSFNQLPELMQKVEFKIYKKFQKPVNQNKFQLTNKNQNKIVQEIISLIKAQNRIQYHAENSQKAIQIVEKNKQFIINQAKKGNPKCYLIFIKFKLKEPAISIKTQDIIQLCQKTKYPLLMYEFICFLSPLIAMKPKIFKNNEQFYYNKALQYLQYLVKIGMPEAFIQKGYFELFNQFGQKSYELFKNAQILGYQPVAHKCLAHIFIQGTKDIPPNMRIGDKYLQSAVNQGYIIRPQFQKILDYIQKVKQDQYKKSLQIKSTQDTQSNQLANFLINKMSEARNKDLNAFFHQTSNVTHYQSYSVVSKQQSFYLLCSPLMNFPARHFLARDIATKKIQFISLYNWDKMDPNKLKLLHEVGTKIVLKNYIRKYGANDGLPLYRVQDPSMIQLYPRTQKHRIQNSQLRTFAKNLFSRNFLDHAFVIYKFLVYRKAEQLEIVYSNLGLIAQRKNKIKQAISFYKKSLNIKTFQKSQVRLARIYIEQKEFNQARKIINEIVSPNEKQSLIKQLQKRKESNNQNKDFSKIIKKNYKIQKKIKDHKISSLMTSLSGAAFNIKQDKFYFLNCRQIFIQALKIPKSISNDAYISQIQKIYNNISLPQLTRQNASRFFNLSQTIYKVRFSKSIYPYSYYYLNSSTMGQLMANQLQFGSQAVNYISMRRQYLQNRIQDMAINFEKKGLYNDAQKLYRYSGKNCTPFNVKVCQLLYLQQKYEQCQKQCSQITQHLKLLPIENFYPYLIEIICFKLKSLIKRKKLKESILQGQSFISFIHKQNSKLLYLSEDSMSSQCFMGMANIFEKKQSKKPMSINPPKDSLQSGEQYLQKVYKQLVLGYLYMKDYQKAKQYLNKIKMKKSKQFTQQQLDQYYQIKYLRILVLKGQKSLKIIDPIEEFIRQIKKETNIKIKQLYLKILTKQKLSIFILSGNIKQLIKISQQIIQIDSINLIYLKNQIIKFIKLHSNKSIQLLELIKKSKILNLLWQDLIYEIDQFKNIQLKQKKNDNEINDKFQQYIHGNKTIINQEFEDDQQKNEAQMLINQQKNLKYQYHVSQKQQNQSTSEAQSLQIDHQNYENQICRFKFNNVQYIVLFDQKMKAKLQVSELRKFISAADHLCKATKGANGIKILGDQVRLKIREAARLTGKLIASENNKNTKFCCFIQRESHDAYRRKNKKQ